MIKPKVPKPSKADESDAYELATLRDNDTCQRCKRDCGPTARDHRVNRSQGGRTVVSNLQVLGLGCHKWATEHPADALADGWAAPGHADPLAWPARRWIRMKLGILNLSWGQYDDAGGFKVIPDAEAMRLMYGD